jgi:spore germination protein YaaH
VAALPWYGRDWDLKERTTEDLTCLADAGDLPPGLCPEWREPEGELTLSFTRDGKRHVVWLPDARKFEWMVNEVRKAGASGIYVWHLGCASGEFFRVVRSEVRKRKG